MMRRCSCILAALCMAGVSMTATTAFITSSSRRTAFVRSAARTLLQMSSSSSATTHQDDWELPEENPQESADNTPIQRRRPQKASKFVTGDELHVLRQQAMDLRQELMQARRRSVTRRVQELERSILQVQSVDAEFVYAVTLEKMQAAQLAGKMDEVELHRQAAMEAREALPQFQMEGLWVGKYGDDCYEMINVTYVGDTMVAHKVTGHSNVPRGEVSFQVNLSPTNELLDPIELDDSAALQWGAKYLPRFAGDGQVASEGFINSQFIEGQLILVNEYFSFAWVPLGHQVFFGRPSPDLTLQMLKDIEEPQTPVEKVRHHLERCMEETEILQEDAEEEADSFYSVDQQDYYSQEGCFE